MRGAEPALLNPGGDVWTPEALGLRSILGEVLLNTGQSGIPEAEGNQSPDFWVRLSYKVSGFPPERESAQWVSCRGQVRSLLGQAVKGGPWGAMGRFHWKGPEAARPPFFRRTQKNNSEPGTSRWVRHAYCSSAPASSVLGRWGWVSLRPFP